MSHWTLYGRSIYLWRRWRSCLLPGYDEGYRNRLQYTAFVWKGIGISADVLSSGSVCRVDSDDADEVGVYTVKNAVVDVERKSGSY